MLLYLLPGSDRQKNCQHNCHDPQKNLPSPMKQGNSVYKKCTGKTAPPLLSINKFINMHRQKEDQTWCKKARQHINRHDPIKDSLFFQIDDQFHRNECCQKCHHRSIGQTSVQQKKKSHHQYHMFIYCFLHPMFSSFFVISTRNILMPGQLYPTTDRANSIMKE